MIVASCDVPVNIAYVIAILIFTHLAKGHAASFERRVVFAGKYVARQTSGLDFNFAYFL